MEAIIKTNKLCKTFSTGGRQIHVIKNLDLEIYTGDFTIIMGSSGSGKTTLLYSLSGMDKPSLGEIYFRDEKITDYSNDQLAVFRRQNCGFVFQQIHLIDNMSVMDNIMAGGLLLSKDKKTIYRKGQELLTEVGLNEEIWSKFPTQISGGEAQRAGIARSLINQPAVLFADEPTGALNSAASKGVLDIFTRIHENGQSIVLVTHDLKTALRGSRILYVRDGAIQGELQLGQDQAEKRLSRLQRFLDEMGW